MKSLSELNAIKDKYKSNVAIRTDEKDIRIVIGMGKSGIVAGARDIMHEIVSLVDDNNLGNRVLIMQEARVSIPAHNPVVKIYDNDNEIATYVNVTKEIAGRIIKEHIIDGKIVQDCLYDATEE